MVAVKSAFQAFQSEIPVYEVNTSDEEENEQESTSFLPTPDPVSLRASPSFPPESRYIFSNFIPDSQNTVLKDGYIIFALKLEQNLLIKGQFLLQVQKGSIMINNAVYNSSSPEMKFINPISHALPLIQSVIGKKGKNKDQKTEHNEHLFNEEYKSVIKISNFQTGLENIGKLCPILRNVFWNSENISDFEVSKLNEFERKFLNYSFLPIISPTNTVTLLNYQNWIEEIESLTKIFKSKEQQSLRILIIGGVNSGKSTLLKLLIQKFLDSNNQSPVNVIDLDPGQFEFSKPDSISLNRITENQFGNHLSISSINDSINHFIGFSSPKDQPRRYSQLVSDLIKRYNSNGLSQNETLLVNSPGWIRGYGLNLTKDLIENVNPTHIIYLDSDLSNAQALEQALEQLELDPSIEFLPMTAHHYASQSPNNNNANNSPKYSSAQLRILKILSYFHKLENFKFDFNQPLLFQPPLQISYGDSGIRAVSILNFSGLHSDDLEASLIGTIVGLHTIDRNVLNKIQIKKNNSKTIPLIDSFELSKLNQVELIFKSLALIHSINQNSKLINLYIPQYEHLEKLQSEEYILIRGTTETPIWEFASKQITKELGFELPFVSFDKSNEFDKVSRVRKSILRR